MYAETGNRFLTLRSSLLCREKRCKYSELTPFAQHPGRKPGCATLLRADGSTRSRSSLCHLSGVCLIIIMSLFNLMLSSQYGEKAENGKG